MADRKTSGAETGPPVRRVLVLGAYGFIGAAVMRRLQRDDFSVAGLGRRERTARQVLPHAEWVIRDLATLAAPEAWSPVLHGFDAVVNCAGALQDSANDDLSIVHETAIAALAKMSAVRGIALVQISAVGARADASTHFLKSKSAGDAAIRAAGGAYWIFRPGLVLGQSAYGGTALLRMLAAVPLVQPIALPDADVQTVSLDDLTKAVSSALAGEIGPGLECDLVEHEPHRFRVCLAEVRAWLGFAPARLEISAPNWALYIMSRGADLLGRLGWRSPLRRSAVISLSDGVVGDPEPFRNLGPFRLSSMTETLAAMPARAEDRLHARLALLQPFILAALFALWFGSGLVGLLRLEDAAKIFTDRGWTQGLAVASVVFWSLADIALAGALLVRRFAARACLGMAGVSLLYLAFASVFAPDLWLDPLGALLKVIPALVLALVAYATLKTR